MAAREPLTDHPEIIRQWDHEKNTIDPTTLSAGAGWIKKRFDRVQHDLYNVYSLVHYLFRQDNVTVI